MSRSALVTLDFFGEPRRFRLALGQLQRLQEKTGVSPFTVYERLVTGHPMAGDAHDVLYLGLVGAKAMSEPEMTRLMRIHLEEVPLADATAPAIVVLGAALYGVTDEEPGKSSGAEPAPMASPPTDV